MERALSRPIASSPTADRYLAPERAALRDIITSASRSAARTAVDQPSIRFQARHPGGPDSFSTRGAPQTPTGNRDCATLTGRDAEVIRFLETHTKWRPWWRTSRVSCAAELCRSTRRATAATSPLRSDAPGTTPLVYIVDRMARCSPASTRQRSRSRHSVARRQALSAAPAAATDESAWRVCAATAVKGQVPAQLRRRSSPAAASRRS